MAINKAYGRRYMRAVMMAVAGAMTLGGCATARDAGPAPVADTISFSAGACFGTCPIYRVVVEPDGSGVLYPQKFTSVPGETRFTVTPLQYRKLRDGLAPFRPMTGTESASNRARRASGWRPTCRAIR